ncbi:MAG TPA: hypothetical protein VL728_15285 [Cyclobacteriaceae bacterium]|nr:hypothetical protein [Cyclobacteriaceae bacterium]
MKKPILFFAFVALMFSAACTAKRDTVSKAVTDSLRRVDSLAKIDSARKAAELNVPKDTALDNTARFIAGLPQLTKNKLSLLENDKYWVDFRKEMDASWKKMYESRLTKMAAWEQDVFSKTVNDSLKLFYPFSGPDFLHANFLYPRSKEYVMLGLERIREVSDLTKISEKDRDRFLDSLGNALRDIFKKSYFITKHMQQDLGQIKGVLPIFYFFMERSGYEILQQKYISLDPTTGDENEVDIQGIYKAKIAAVKLLVRNRETKLIKTVYYFSGDVQDLALKNKAGLVKFITDRGPFNTFLKSASYLLHYETFAVMRKVVLSNTASIFQDDTGVPYRYFSNKPEWKVQLFGDYVPPVSDFSANLFQKDLDSAYKKGSLVLPFSLGYHWSSKQNYMLVAKESIQLNK